LRGQFGIELALGFIVLGIVSIMLFIFPDALRDIAGVIAIALELVAMLGIIAALAFVIYRRRQRKARRDTGAEAVEETPERAESHSATGEAQEGAQKSWWRRIFGGER